jgi:dolichol-phosphate mannosyltransferase
MVPRMGRSEPTPDLISVVVPCLNEDSVIDETYRRLVEVLATVTNSNFELLFVDDGSGDLTLTRLRYIQAQDSRVRVVAFSRNFGHQAAVTAGIEHSSGNAVVLIDADLQDPPEVIRQMVARWRAGADVVYGSRTQRDGETAFKLWSARLFYRSLNRISDVVIPLDTGDFRLMDRRVVDAFLKMPEGDRFIRGMVAWLGFRQERLPYRRAVRHAGVSKYPLRKMLRFSIDGLLSFSTEPLRWAIWLGFIVTSMAMAVIIYALLARILTGTRVPGWAFFGIAICLLGGLQLIFMGILGEYVGRIYGEVKRRPLYVVRERLGFSTARELTISDEERIPSVIGID